MRGAVNHLMKLFWGSELQEEAGLEMGAMRERRRGMVKREARATRKKRWSTTLTNFTVLSHLRL